MTPHEKEKFLGLSRLEFFLLFTLFCVILSVIVVFGILLTIKARNTFVSTITPIVIQQKSAQQIAIATNTFKPVNTLPPVWTPTPVNIVPTSTLFPSSTPMPTSTMFQVNIPKQNNSPQILSYPSGSQSCPSASDQSWHEYILQELKSNYLYYVEQSELEIRTAVLYGDSMGVWYIQQDLAIAKADYKRAVANENSRFDNLCK